MSAVAEISGAAWVGVQAALAATEGMPSDASVVRIFGASQVQGTRTAEQWMELYIAAREGECTMAEAAEFAEE